ncbi:hypothetical protein Q9Q94_13650 [Uliginosibacterium sp. 31-16]|uniref:MinD/ParA family ATP-binding protein n=1 Tax=Uliginosibacterium sp. 31-16 TaxID=3068315 RepID=UPI002740116E|nr:hypothetical protein [Uliginosibacterium sp. 31-16]MDP5240584.1 hypothetical protein [Uliginosibacterium sp. 31-16]
MKKQMDQADGLRRLFRTAPPEVMAVLPCGAVTTRWVALQAQARARAGRQVLALDERQACGNLADCLGVSPRFDLLQAVTGQIGEAQCVQDVMPGLQLAQVGQLVRELGAERVTNQRTVNLLQSLQAGCDEWLLLAQPGEMEGLSPLVLAAPRLTLVVDAHPQSVTAAWASLARLVREAPEMSFVLCHAGEHDARARATLDRFCQLAAQRLGRRVEQAGSLGEALLLRHGMGELTTRYFLQRILQTCRPPAVKPFEARFPGTPAHVRMSLP